MEGQNVFYLTTTESIMKTLPLVAIQDYPGLHCANSPYSSRNILELTWEDFFKAGFEDSRILVRREIIPFLYKAKEHLNRFFGKDLVFVDGLHPDYVYDILESRVNPNLISTHARYLIKHRMHSTGYVVNALLFDPIHKRIVPPCIDEDGDKALFAGYYRPIEHRNDAGGVVTVQDRLRGQKFGEQRELVRAMGSAGFTTDPLNRICHFEHTFLRSNAGHVPRY